MHTSSIWRGRRRKGNRKGGKGKREKRNGTYIGGVYQGLGQGPKLRPSPPTPRPPWTAACRRKTDRISRTTNHNFKISTSECIKYPPKCSFSKVNKKIRVRGLCRGHSPSQTTPRRRWGNPLSAALHSLSAARAFGARCSAQTSVRSENWYPPHFSEQSYALGGLVDSCNDCVKNALVWMNEWMYEWIRIFI